MTVMTEYPVRRTESSTASVPVVHLVHREGLGSVFEAMVMTPWSRLCARGLEADLINFTPVGEFIRKQSRKKWIDRLDAIENQHLARFHRLASPPARARWLWNDTWMLRRWLAQRFDRETSFILHCRGPQATNLALEMRRGWPGARIIFDMRGLVHAEQLYENRSTGKGLFDLERRAAQQADAMICVSNAMADYAATTFDNYRDAITVIPCCVETSGPDPRVQRDLIREQLGLRGKFVVAYCGGLQRWQLPLESAKLFKRIRWMQPSTYLLALTSDPIKMRNILSDAGVPQDQATVLNVPHSGVSHYLAAADLGLLLRERHLINAVASPVKFGEFMASSVPVIISDGVGDFSDLVRTEGLGIVLGNLNDLSQLTGWFDRWPIEQYGIRARCRELACIRLSLDWQMVELLKLYDQLVQDVRA